MTLFIFCPNSNFLNHLNGLCACLEWSHSHSLHSFEYVTLYISFSEARIWLETRDPCSPEQRVCGAERPGLEYRVRGLRGGRESAGQVEARSPFPKNSRRAHHHPRYNSHHPTPSIHIHAHTQQPQCTKASTVTRKTLLLRFLYYWPSTYLRLLAAGSDMNHLSPSVTLGWFIVFTILNAVSNKVDILWCNPLRQSGYIVCWMQ